MDINLEVNWGVGIGKVFVIGKEFKAKKIVGEF